MTIDPNAPAFSQVNPAHDSRFPSALPMGGLTIRAYLAGQAMIGLSPLSWTIKDKAVYAIQQADALIAALNQPNP